MQNQPQLEFLYEITAHLDARLLLARTRMGTDKLSL
jgi:hypothetical protein